MDRLIAVVGAPSSLGLRPYPDGEARNVDRAPSVLRERGLIHRVGAIDMGSVEPPPYRDYVRPPGRPRNEREVAAYSKALGNRVAAAARSRRFVLVLGGDCSVLLGSLIGARQTAAGPVGLAYVDAHADFVDAEQSLTGSIAAMTLALALGRGNTPLAWLGGSSPLVDARHVVLVAGRDDPGESGNAGSLPFLSVTDTHIADQGIRAAASRVLSRVTTRGLASFWIHLDVDALNPAVMPAVAARVPGGSMINEMADLLAPIVRHPKAAGLTLSNYDPALDPDRSGARQLVGLVEKLLAPSQAQRRAS